MHLLRRKMEVASHANGQHQYHCSEKSPTEIIFLSESIIHNCIVVCSEVLDSLLLLDTQH